MSEDPTLNRIRAALSANDALVRSGGLGEGHSIAAQRTAIFDQVLGEWVSKLHKTSGDSTPLALVALGGTGRQEVCPCSDLDYAVLVARDIDNHPAVAEIQRQTRDSSAFAEHHGFPLEIYPFDLESVIDFPDPRQLNSFLDMRAVYDPGGLAPRFRARIAETFDPFEHFLHLRSFWVSQWEQAAGQSERLDRFDIKNDGLRVFLAAVWLLASKEFKHSHEIYPGIDPRARDAYAMLLRVRQFIHLRWSCADRRSMPLLDGKHAEDVLTFDDFLSFGDMLDDDADEVQRFEFSNDVRARLLGARRQVAVFAKGIIGQELRDGREVFPGRPYFLGAGGLWAKPPKDPPSDRDKSRTALELLAASQHYELPIDPCELQSAFQNAGDWLKPVPELADLLYERGSLAQSFAFLAQIPGAEELLFPGYGRFEASLDGRVMSEKKSLRGVLANAKISALENWVSEGKKQLDEAFSSTHLKDQEKMGVTIEIEAAQLDADQLAAIKLALKTKRLPLTPTDSEARKNTSLPLHARFASGISDISVDTYYRRYAESCGLSDEVVDLTTFLVREQRALRTHADVGMAEESLVEALVTSCRDEAHLRCLFVFSYADRAEWHSEEVKPDRWFIIRELYGKAMRKIRPTSGGENWGREAGLTAEDMRVFDGFGPGLVNGAYRPHLPRFASPLLRLAADPADEKPKAILFRDGRSWILGVASRDFRGLATIITGSLLAEGFDLVQAHMFSSARHRLVLDFFHLGHQSGSETLSSLPGKVEAATRQRLFIDEATPLAFLSPSQQRECSIEEWRPGLFCLSIATRGEQSTGTIVHALVQTIYHKLGGNVHALKAHNTRGMTFVSVYLSLPDNMSLDEARRILEE